ncbi:MAG TPA: PHB depolymerase family esterase, partial [Polyangiaceae bacterium]|nr:PHB depolymerase family esterase [Polyangiaceae bacterium]
MRGAFVFLMLAACGGSESTTNDGGADAATDVTTNDVVQTQDAAIDVSLPSDAGACGTRTGQRGLTQRTLNGRTYEVYLPTALDPKTSVPIVIVHHGYTMSGDSMRVITQYSALADSENIAVVFPDGQGGPNSLGAPWNVGPGNCPSTTGPVPVATGDDFAFDEAMRADVEEDQCVDEKHTFVTGFSMGGYFSHHIGCMRPDFARAIAPHSGGTHDFSTCAAGHEPVIVFHGDSDPLISMTCDDAAVQQWIVKNGCQTSGTAVSVKGGTCTYYDGCPADG